MEVIYNEENNSQLFMSMEWSSTFKGAAQLDAYIEKAIASCKASDAKFCAVSWHCSSFDLNDCPILTFARKVQESGVEVIAHLTPQNLTKSEILQILHYLKKNRIRHIFALRGDKNDLANKACFSYAKDLVLFIRNNFGNYFRIFVAGYPSGHSDRLNKNIEIQYLKEKEHFEESQWEPHRADGWQKLKPNAVPSTLFNVQNPPKKLISTRQSVYKDTTPSERAGENGTAYPAVGNDTALSDEVDAGADYIITQTVFNASEFVSFVKKCRKLGIRVPIIPGIMPVQNAMLLSRLDNKCKFHFTEDIYNALITYKDSEEDLVKFGIQKAKETILEIIKSGIGVQQFHFFTINRPEPTIQVWKELKEAYGTQSSELINSSKSYSLQRNELK